MYNNTVMNRSEVPVGGALAALADPTRRGMVELLRQHGLIEEQRPDGDRRGRVYRLRPGSLDPLAGWLDEVRRFWAEHLEQFRTYAEGFAPRDPANTMPTAREEP